MIFITQVVNDNHQKKSGNQQSQHNVDEQIATHAKLLTPPGTNVRRRRWPSQSYRQTSVQRQPRRRRPRGGHSPIHEGMWWAPKIGIFHPLLQTTHFPLQTNGFEGRFELLSASRIQRNSQIQLLIKNEKVRLDNLRVSIGASEGEIVVTEVCESG